MTDPHLNIFYTYNRDTELIENNLTRAWIVALQFLTGETRNYLLRDLFLPFLVDKEINLPDFSSAQFSLQGNVDQDQIISIRDKFLLTISTSREFDLEMNGQISEGDSIPDAWIFDIDHGYCFLVEAKVGSYPLSNDQVITHAKNWLGVRQKQLDKHLISISWNDVVESISMIKTRVENPLEITILDHLEEFLGLFGYRLFPGFSFTNLASRPNFRLSSSCHQLSLQGLVKPPEFRLSVRNME